MSEAADRLVLCQQMLGEIGTRSTITSLIPPDGSTEAFYCALFYNTTLQQVLRAAHWNFAGRTDYGTLWKALPGTPENPTIPAGYRWSFRDPAAPWLYSYLYPPYSAIAVRRIREQQSQNGADFISSVPLFGGVATGTNFTQLPCVQFEVASDRFDRLGTWLYQAQTVTAVTVVNAGSGYQGGDYITMDQSGASYGQPLILQVNLVTATGSIPADAGAPGVGIRDGGSFAVFNSNPLTQSSTTGNGTGFTCSATFGPHEGIKKVCLTNARSPIIDYTTSDVYVAEYDAGFADAFMLAMEGKLALALLGDKVMYKAKLEEANSKILEARIRDGNEGLTVQDHVPDWLQVRGVGSMTPVDRYFPAYGPLFAV
jgi:hypothetical protein